MKQTEEKSSTLKTLQKLLSANWNPSQFKSDQTSNHQSDDDEEGQLIVDMYEKNNSYYIIAPAAGVVADDIEIELNDDFIAIRGKRQKDTDLDDRIYHLQECYWGSFTRQINFPTSVDSENAAATFKDGMLTICVPKAKSVQTKTLKIKTL
ncbi:MAG: Hsp20/alpha crystallin family protein [Patescibacteria group bacterium]